MTTRPTHWGNILIRQIADSATHPARVNAKAHRPKVTVTPRRGDVSPNNEPAMLWLVALCRQLGRT